MLFFRVFLLLIVCDVVVCTPPGVDPSSVPCRGNGVVVVPATEASNEICECDPDWLNKYTSCSLYDCHDPNGYWNANYWEPQCICYPGWTGERCNITDPNITQPPTPTPTGIPTNTTGHTDNINPVVPSFAESSSSAVSTAMYIGIAIGIASMCGLMLVFGMLYRSRNSLNHLKQRLLNANSTRSNYNMDIPTVGVQLPNPTTITQMATVQTTTQQTPQTHNDTDTNSQTSTAVVVPVQP